MPLLLPHWQNQKLIKECRLYVGMEDPDVVIDLMTLQSGHKTKYDDFRRVSSGRCWLGNGRKKIIRNYSLSRSNFSNRSIRTSCSSVLTISTHVILTTSPYISTTAGRGAVELLYNLSFHIHHSR